MFSTHRFYQAADEHGSSKAFCPNCGHAITAADEFCGNCGFNLKGEQKAQPAEPESKTVAATTTTQRRQTSNAHRAQPHMPKWSWITIGIIILIAIGGYLYGQHYYNPTN